MTKFCQNIVSEDTLEFCGNQPAEEYELNAPFDSGILTGPVYFCDECGQKLSDQWDSIGE